MTPREYKYLRRKHWSRWLNRMMALSPEELREYIAEKTRSIRRRIIAHNKSKSLDSKSVYE